MFPITIGFLQLCASSPYLSTLIIDDITKHIKHEVLWCLLCGDDIVLIDESRAEINYKLEL